MDRTTTKEILHTFIGLLEALTTIFDLVREHVTSTAIRSRFDYDLNGCKALGESAPTIFSSGLKAQQYYVYSISSALSHHQSDFRVADH